MEVENPINLGLLQVKNTLLSQIEELKKDVEAVERLLQRHIAINGNGKLESAPLSNEPPVVKKSELDVASYSLASTWKHKIYFVLKELGTAYSEDVARKLMQHDSSITKEIAEKNATLYLSMLYGLGEIRASRDGRKNRYSI